jgi:hypothetical protein
MMKPDEFDLAGFCAIGERRDLIGGARIEGGR